MQDLSLLFILCLCYCIVITIIICQAVESLLHHLILYIIRVNSFVGRAQGYVAIVVF